MDDDIARETLNHLEWRLSRLEFYLQRHHQSISRDAPSASTPNSVPADESVRARVAKLEHAFEDLCSRSPAVAQLAELYTAHPDLFAAETAELENNGGAKLPIVLSSADALQEAASHLHELREKQVPDASTLTALLALQSRLAWAEAVQDAQNEQLAALRQRSALALATWHTNSVLAGGEQWSEWERRLTKVEQMIRRTEVERAKTTQQM